MKTQWVILAVLLCLVFTLSYKPRSGILNKFIVPQQPFIGPDVWVQSQQGPIDIPHGDWMGRDRPELKRDLAKMATN